MVRDACPKSCGFCFVEIKGDRTCFDKPAADFSFVSDDNHMITCEFLRYDEYERQKYCVDTTISDACPQTCGLCCEDSTSFKFRTSDGKKRDCEWIANHGTESGQAKTYCNTRNNGALVRVLCPQACGACKDFIEPKPSESPSKQPTLAPTHVPSSFPSNKPHRTPSSIPSATPSTLPSVQPSKTPTQKGTIPDVTKAPTVARPTTVIVPTITPTNDILQPSDEPSVIPSKDPSIFPSEEPSTLPSNEPSILPSNEPSILPSNEPSVLPSEEPSILPSNEPSILPSNEPSIQPSNEPSTLPSEEPSQSLVYVEFSNGVITNGETCGVDCCYVDFEADISPCFEFTGKVAKDGSCNGNQACSFANIPIVSGGSCVGQNACSATTADRVIGGSCVGLLACDSMTATTVSEGSCVGEEACFNLNSATALSAGSCVGDRVCAVF
jgi:hypothetical protein